MENKVDKRTKAYKKSQKELEAKHAEQSEGLGDTIEKIAKKTGIDKVVNFIAGEDCGCDKRKEAMNKLFRYKKPLCLTEQEYETLDDILNRPHVKRMRSLKHSEQTELLKISNRIFRTLRPVTSCNSCGRELVKDLTKVYESY